MESFSHQNDAYGIENLVHIDAVIFALHLFLHQTILEVYFSYCEILRNICNPTAFPVSQ